MSRFVNPAVISPLLLLVAVAARGQSYQHDASSQSSGTPQSGYAGFEADLGSEPGGGMVAASLNYTLKPGFTGQLYEVADLSLDSQAPVGESAGNQLSATAVMNDGSGTVLPASEVDWGIVAGPVLSISSSGLAQTGIVYANSTARTSAQWRAGNASLDWQVLNSDDDNFAPVDGDGLDDAWQFTHFDSDKDGQLSQSEAVQAAPSADPDADGQDNSFEILSGYLPNDASSFLSFRIESVAGGGTSFSISKVIPDTLYRIHGSDTLFLERPWPDLEIGFTGVDALNYRLSHRVPPERKFFYYLSLEPGP